MLRGFSVSVNSVDDLFLCVVLVVISCGFICVFVLGVLAVWGLRLACLLVLGVIDGLVWVCVFAVGSAVVRVVLVDGFAGCYIMVLLYLVYCI